MAGTQHKICLLIDSKTYGGIETHVCHLAKGLVASGKQVCIVLITDHGFHPVFDQDDSIKSIMYKAEKGIFSLFSLLEKLEVDLIHTHGYKAGIFGRLFGFIYQKAIVSTFHAGERGNLKMRFYCWLDRVTAFRSTCICVSKQIAQSISSNTTVIQNFVEMPKEDNLDTKQAKKIAFVGRFSFEKGPDLFYQIVTKLPEMEFTMFGDGPMFRQINRLKPRNLTLVGQVNSMSGYWSQIKLLCITSREEGLPLVALEALARGIPVVSYDVGGLASVVHDNQTGWLIPPLNEHAFINRLKKIAKFNHSSSDKIALFSKNYIKTNFSSRAIIPKIIQCYSSALMEQGYA